MAREGLQSDALSAWAEANHAILDGVEIQDRDDGRGYAIIAQRDLVEQETGPLITVPKHLTQSSAMVHERARDHAPLQELLDAAVELAEVCGSPRG